MDKKKNKNNENEDDFRDEHGRLREPIQNIQEKKKKDYDIK